jgi:putative peptidoglycan lipid II flippase
MKPELGDVVINRYTLVSLLRDEPGLQAWKANDPRAGPRLPAVHRQ